MKAKVGCGGIFPFILNIQWVVNFTLQPGTHCIGRWVDPRRAITDLKIRKITYPIGNRIPGYPARSPVANQLRVPARLLRGYWFKCRLGIGKTEESYENSDLGLDWECKGSKLPTVSALDATVKTLTQ